MIQIEGNRDVVVVMLRIWHIFLPRWVIRGVLRVVFLNFRTVSTSCAPRLGTSGTLNPSKLLFEKPCLALVFQEHFLLRERLFLCLYIRSCCVILAMNTRFGWSACPMLVCVGVMVRGEPRMPVLTRQCALSAN